MNTFTDTAKSKTYYYRTILWFFLLISFCFPYSVITTLTQYCLQDLIFWLSFFFILLKVHLCVCVHPPDRDRTLRVPIGPDQCTMESYQQNLHVWHMEDTDMEGTVNSGSCSHSLCSQPDFIRCCIMTTNSHLEPVNVLYDRLWISTGF